MADRETGTETVPCPNDCGTDLAVVELQEGVVSTVLCETCYGPAEAEKAAAKSNAMPREYGTEKDEETEEETEEVTVKVGDDD